MLKGSPDQESNFITSPNEVVVDSETDHSDAGSSRFDSINTTGDFTFEEEAKDSKSIAIEPANDEIEREEKEDKTIYEITIPVDADKLGCNQYKRVSPQIRFIQVLFCTSQVW